MKLRPTLLVVWSLIFLLLGSMISWAQTDGQPTPKSSLLGLGDVLKGLIGFVFGLLAFWVQRLYTRERRSLSANISTFSLLSLPETIRGQIQVKFQDQPVENILSNRVTFLNTGNQVIQNHEIKVTLGEGSKILHVDPGQRFEVVNSSEHYARLKLTFLNPRSSTDIGITTTGGGEQNLNIEGEGPGIQFKSGERILPVLDPNMTSDELLKLLRRVMWDRSKRTLPWVIAIYIVFIGLMALIVYWTS